MSEWDWTRVVFDHVKIVVRDAGASIAFYKTVLEPLAIPPLWESDRGAQFANLVVWGDEHASGPIHVAFVADSRDRWTRSTAPVSRRIPRQRRSRCPRAVQLDEAGRYYAAFLLDPDGNNVEAVRREF